jgi:hypothetical protein
MRPSGLPNAGMLESGAHIVHFYRHMRELMETHATFCASGLLHNEYCLWITTLPFTEKLARCELEKLSILRPLNLTVTLCGPVAILYPTGPQASLLGSC